MVYLRIRFKCFLVIFLLIFIICVIIGFQLLSDDNDQQIFDDVYSDYGDDHHEHIPLDEEIHQQASGHTKIHKPILLWWTPLTGEKGKYKQCGNDQCYLTVDRKYRNHPQTKVFFFYGSDLAVDDLPLPRLPHQEWALFHEESPKNNYLFSHADMMSLFNHTSTFRRESDYPITTQHLISLNWLESTKYMVPVEYKHDNLLYVHSDCDTPSDRDSYVKSLMTMLQIDSYGTCLHNKDLPEHLKDPVKGMAHDHFHELVSKYKFSFAMENGVCTDYITEKLWRPLMVGSVPIIYGSPSVQELLPSNYSAILIDNFKTVEELATYIKYLNHNDAEYEKYLEWKKTGITNPKLKRILQTREWRPDEVDTWSDTDFNFIDGFECFVCKRIHENIRLQNQRKPIKRHQATGQHYGCPQPKKFKIGNKVSKDDMNWEGEWLLNSKMAKHLNNFITKNITFTKNLLLERALKDLT